MKVWEAFEDCAKYDFGVLYSRRGMELSRSWFWGKDIFIAEHKLQFWFSYALLQSHDLMLSLSDSEIASNMEINHYTHHTPNMYVIMKFFKNNSQSI